MVTALALIGATGSAGASDDAEQAEMFAADAAMPTMLPPSPAAKSGPQGGRPKGARNKSTEAWRELFLSKFRHPMMVLGELTSRTPEQLARDLKLYKYHEGKQVLAPILDAHGAYVRDAYGDPCWQPVLATGEAAKMQQDAATALLPYLGQKLPMAIEVAPPSRGVVVIGNLDVPDEEAEHGLSLPLPAEDENQQNQQVIEGESVRLSDETSHADLKPLKDIGDFVDDV